MKIPKGKLNWTGRTGDGKALFMGHESDDGWQDLRIEIDTDDCDGKYAKMMGDELIRRWNSFEK